MLRTVVSLLRRDFPEAKLAMTPGWNAPFIRRAQLGLYQKIWYQRFRVPFWRLARLIPAKLRNCYGLVMDSEVDVVIDASGFRYGDQWGEQMSRKAAKSIKRWKRQGTKVVLLPQAFGPFTSKLIRKHLETIIGNSDLVFTREKSSHENVSTVVGERSHVQIAPDFTNLIDGERPPYFEAGENRVAIIPNYRMVDKTDTETTSRYVPFLAACARAVIENGGSPFLLIHEGRNDVWLAEQVNAHLNDRLEILEEPDALRLKGLIGGCSGVISSRFHGLVSALSQGVPALGTGWSHKYSELFRDYGFEDGIMDIRADNDEIRGKIELVTRPDSRAALSEKLLAVAREQKAASAAMWAEVVKVIRS